MWFKGKRKPVIQITAKFSEMEAAGKYIEHAALP